MEDEVSEDCSLHRNAMIVTLSQYCIVTQQQGDASKVPFAQLSELRRSVSDDINLV